MKSITFFLVANDFTEEDKELAKKIFYATLTYTDKLRDKYTTILEFHSVNSYGDLNTTIPCVCFGDCYHYVQTTTKVWLLPDIKSLYPRQENKKHREEAFVYIRQIGKEMDELCEEMKEEAAKAQKYIQLENTTIGLENTDILISEQEAEYLKKIKDIFGGGKMTITKGDIKIEVE
jgi:hypothetical protein